jgi:REP element-mobilizing transposase RayT
MPVEIPPKIAVSAFAGYLKGKSSLKEYIDPFTGEPVNKNKKQPVYGRYGTGAT